MSDASSVSELTQTHHDTAGIQLLVSSCQWDSPIPGVDTTEIKSSHLDETVYRVGITGTIHDRLPEHVALSVNDKASLGVADTPEGVTFRLHTDDDDVQLHPSEFVAGKQAINMELPDSTALADIDSPRITRDLVESDYLDEPYYRISLTGFVVGASSNGIKLATTDGHEFRLKAQKHGNASIAHVDSSDDPEFEPIRALDSGLVFPE